jgi:hypothetical protein
VCRYESVPDSGDTCPLVPCPYTRTILRRSSVGGSSHCLPPWLARTPKGGSFLGLQREARGREGSGAAAASQDDLGHEQGSARARPQAAAGRSVNSAEARRRLGNIQNPGIFRVHGQSPGPTLFTCSNRALQPPHNRKTSYYMRRLACNN